MVQIVRLMVLAAIAVLASLPFHHASTATATTAAGVEPSWQPASERSQPVRRHPYAGEELKNPDWMALQVAWQAEFDAAQPAAAAAQGPAAPTALTAVNSGAIPQLIQDIFSPLGAGAVDWAERVARCESSYNPRAYNQSSGASGLFQFLPSTWAGTPYASQSAFDPMANTKAAAWEYQRSGGGAWSCK